VYDAKLKDLLKLYRINILISPPKLSKYTLSYNNSNVTVDTANLIYIYIYNSLSEPHCNNFLFPFVLLIHTDIP